MSEFHEYIRRFWLLNSEKVMMLCAPLTMERLEQVDISIYLKAIKANKHKAIRYNRRFEAPSANNNEDINRINDFIYSNYHRIRRRRCSWTGK